MEAEPATNRRLEIAARLNLRSSWNSPPVADWHHGPTTETLEASIQNYLGLRQSAMLNRRMPLHGLLAVLLALMAQLGTGARIPRVDAFAQIVGANALCHSADESGTNPSQPPSHPADCLACPLCVAVQAPAATLIHEGAVAIHRGVVAVLRPELPPPSTAPPFYRWQPSQPRAPPTYS